VSEENAASKHDASTRDTNEGDTARGRAVRDLLDDHLLFVFIFLIVLLSIFSYVIGLANVKIH